MSVRVFHGVSGIDPVFRGAVLSVGNFDGVHLGHQRILRTARALAHVSSSAVMAMTFEPHPLVLLKPEAAPPRLTPWDEKVRQLAVAGADVVVRLETDRTLLSLPAEDFVRDILVKQIHPSYIVEGPDFGFGRGRKGNVQLLREMSAKGGYQVHVVEPYRLAPTGSDEAIVSSTAIRAALKSGDIPHATACLGRPYALVGKVIHGAGAGKKLGYPTINLDVGSQMIPAEGVYAGVVELPEDGRRGLAAISIGTRPTLGGTVLAVEGFVLDAEGDWYGETARLELHAYLRAQQKFENVEALTTQIGEDVKATRRLVRLSEA